MLAGALLLAPGCSRDTIEPCVPEAVTVTGRGLYQEGPTYIQFAYEGGATAAEIGRGWSTVKAGIEDPTTSDADFTFVVRAAQRDTMPPFRSLSAAMNLPQILRDVKNVQPMDPVNRWRTLKLGSATAFTAVLVDSAGVALPVQGTMEVLHAWPLDLLFNLVSNRPGKPEIVVNGWLLFRIVDAPCPE